MLGAQLGISVPTIVGYAGFLKKRKKWGEKFLKKFPQIFWVGKLNIYLAKKKNKL